MVEEVIFSSSLRTSGKVVEGGGDGDTSGTSELRIVPANFRPGKRLPQVVQRLFLDVDAVAVVVKCLAPHCWLRSRHFPSLSSR